MATVYLARDLRHDRRVALKVLKPELGAVLGVERFLSEIKVTANLQHPNLLPLFDSGEAGGLLFYVMPYVEGETLRARLDREKQLPVSEAVRIATAVASALAYAHEHGVIHRDLKPENILMQAGQPVIADFGIALAVSNAGGQRVTQTGLSLGTPQYMSPEQAAGDRVIDGRTDIYSLGAVTYEMLGGEPPHSGTSAQAIIAKLMTAEPQPLRTLRSSVPLNVADAVEKSLAKLPADRFTRADDFAAALANESFTLATGAARRGGRARGRWRSRVRDPWFLTLVALALYLGGALAVLGRHAAAVGDDYPLHFELTTGAEQPTGVATLSPDGHTVVYVARSPSGTNNLYVHRLDRLEAQIIPGTDNAAQPVFAPDGKWVVFVADRRKLMKVPLDGGAAVPLADVDDIGGVDWLPGDELVVGPGATEVRMGLSRVSAAGGALVPFTSVDSARNELGHLWPTVVDDGKTVLFSLWYGAQEQSQLASVSVGSRAVVPLGVTAVRALGVVGGRLVYLRADGVVMAIPFDVRTGRTSGSAVPVLDSIRLAADGAGDSRVALTSAGGLVIARGALNRRIVWVDRTGEARPAANDIREFGFVRLSPNGRQAAVVLNSGPKSDVWILDVATRTLTPLSTGGSSRSPNWSADSRRVAFISRQGGRSALWWQPADASGPAIKAATPSHNPWWLDVSPDGRAAVFNSLYDRSWNVVTLALDSTHAEREFAASPTAREVMGRFSPDGRSIAYTSDESGRSEVYVRPFPEPGSRVQISVGGGRRAIWAPDGRRLFFWEGSRLMEATLVRDPGLRVVSREALFEGRYEADYDVSRDGTRFLMIEAASSGLRLVVVPHWLTELRQRTAAGAAK